MFKKNELNPEYKHGGWKSKEWNSWDHMKRRCNNPKDPKYPYYGARGIKVCDRWLYSFEKFLADMGKAPSPKHSLDRFPNNNGNYEPGNCRWATPVEQARNTRRNVSLTYKGRTMLVIEWAELLGVDRSVIIRRRDNNLDLMTGLEEPSSP